MGQIHLYLLLCHDEDQRLDHGLTRKGIEDDPFKASLLDGRSVVLLWLTLSIMTPYCSLACTPVSGTQGM